MSYIAPCGWGRLATFARESYAAEGRGYICFTVPPIPDPDQPSKMEMVYYVLTQVQRLAANLSGVLREQADILIRMIETYDPATQAVVMAAVGTVDPIAIKMRLVMPFVVDEAEASIEPSAVRTTAPRR